MRNVFGWSVLSVALCGSLVVAQQPRPNQPNVRPGVRPGATQPARPGVAQPGQPRVQAAGQNQQADQQIATLIVSMNRNEVETAKFAMPKLESSEAKEVATMLIKDHTEAMNKFARYAGQGGAATNTGIRTNTGDRDADSGRDAGRREEGRREEGRRDENRREEGTREEGRREEGRRDDQKSAANPTTAPNNPGNVTAGNTGAAAARTSNNQGNANAGVANPNAGNAARGGVAANQGGGQPTQARTALRPVMGGGLDWLSVHQEIADEALAGAKKELSRYEGNEFDKAFLGHQIAGHMMAVTKLKVLKRHASSELGGEIDNALATTESHLKHIRSLMDEKKEEKSDSKKRGE